MSENENFENNIDGTLELLKNIELEEQFNKWMAIKEKSIFSSFRPLTCNNILDSLKKTIDHNQQFYNKCFDRHVYEKDYGYNK